MRTFIYRYLELKDLCDYNRLDFADVMDAISDSHVSFGTNYDTLITTTQLQDILDNSGDFGVLRYDDHDDIDDILLISLGS